MWKRIKEQIKILGITLLMLVLLGSCSISKTNYARKYAEAWKEVLKSEAWKNSLVVENDQNMNLYSSNEDIILAESAKTAIMEMDGSFLIKYNSLVSRAYVKIISEAEHANGRLKKEFERWNLKKIDPLINKKGDFKKEYNHIIERYEAHKKMLDGLKSWDVFDEFGTADLEYFKNENSKNVHLMMQDAKSDFAIIGYLVYKLADLYHFDD